MQIQAPYVLAIIVIISQTISHRAQTLGPPGHGQMGQHEQDLPLWNVPAVSLLGMEAKTLLDKEPQQMPFLPQPCVEHTSHKKLNLTVTSQENTSTFCLGCHCLGCLTPLMPDMRALGFHRPLEDQERGHPRKEIQTWVPEESVCLSNRGDNKRRLPSHPLKSQSGQEGWKKQTNNKQIFEESPFGKHCMEAHSALKLHGNYILLHDGTS